MLKDYYAHMMRRERQILARRLGIERGEVLSVGCGWHPGRHLFPEQAFRLVGVDADPDRVAGVIETGRADDALVGYAGQLELPDSSFDVVLYRLALHHLDGQRVVAGPAFLQGDEVIQARPRRRLGRHGGGRLLRQPHHGTGEDGLRPLGAQLGRHFLERTLAKAASIRRCCRMPMSMAHVPPDRAAE